MPPGASGSPQGLREGLGYLGIGNSERRAMGATGRPVGAIGRQSYSCQAACVIVASGRSLIQISVPASGANALVM